MRRSDCIKKMFKSCSGYSWVVVDTRVLSSERKCFSLIKPLLLRPIPDVNPHFLDSIFRSFSMRLSCNRRNECDPDSMFWDLVSIFVQSSLCKSSMVWGSGCSAMFGRGRMWPSAHVFCGTSSDFVSPLNICFYTIQQPMNTSVLSIICVSVSGTQLWVKSQNKIRCDMTAFYQLPNEMFTTPTKCMEKIGLARVRLTSKRLANIGR